jgi:hypothetical protein
MGLCRLRDVQFRVRRSYEGLDEATGYIVTALFLITAVPALALIIFSRALKTALTLALTFPATFTALFTAAIIAFA